MTLVTQINSALTRLTTEFKAIRILISGTGTGDISGLSTTDKTSLVAAINEVKATGGGGAPADASTTTKGVIEIATLAEMATGTSALLAATPEGVRQERIALKDEILGAGVPAAMDTLDELAAALGDDANFASTVTTGLANRLRVDTAAQGLTGTQQANGRTNLSVYSQAEIGDINTDFVAVVEAGLA